MKTKNQIDKKELNPARTQRVMLAVADRISARIYEGRPVKAIEQAFFDAVHKAATEKPAQWMERGTI